MSTCLSEKVFNDRLLFGFFTLGSFRMKQDILNKNSCSPIFLKFSRSFDCTTDICVLVNGFTNPQLSSVISNNKLDSIYSTYLTPHVCSDLLSLGVVVNMVVGPIIFLFLYTCAVV